MKKSVVISGEASETDSDEEIASNIMKKVGNKIHKQTSTLLKYLPFRHYMALLQFRDL